jgi:hypothetical protein
MKNTLAQKLSGKLYKFKKTICHKLNDQVKNYSIRKKKMLLVVFCVLFGSISIGIVVHTFYEKTLSGSIPALNPLSIPYHIGKNFHQPGVMIDPGTYARVEKFKLYLDSLKTHNPGRFAEIINTRPHLVDSIIAFEKIYLLQLKK